MISRDEVERLNVEAAQLGRYSIHMSVVLSVIFALATVAIISKKHLTNNWVDMAAFAIPIPIALYFKNRIVRLGIFAYIAALILTLGAAVLFGI